MHHPQHARWGVHSGTQGPDDAPRADVNQSVIRTNAIEDGLTDRQKDTMLHGVNLIMHDEIGRGAAKVEAESIL